MQFASLTTNTGEKTGAQMFASKALNLHQAVYGLVGGVHLVLTSPRAVPAKNVRTRTVFSKVFYLLLLGNACTKYKIQKVQMGENRE